MSDTARHEDMPVADLATVADGDLSLPLNDALMAPMPVPRRAMRPAPKPSAAGKSDSAFERALEALEGALEAAISDASVFIPTYTAPVTKLTLPTPVSRMMPQARPMPAVTPELVDIAVPAAAPTVAPEPAIRTVEPKFLPQEDIGDGDPIFVTPEFERVALPSTTSAAAQAIVARSMNSRSALRAATFGYGVPPLLLTADATLRVRAAAKAVMDALPKIDMSIVDMPAPQAMPEPVIETPAAPKMETATAATSAATAEEIDPFVLYPFGKTTLRLMVM